MTTSLHGGSKDGGSHLPRGAFLISFEAIGNFVSIRRSLACIASSYKALIPLGCEHANLHSIYYIGFCIYKKCSTLTKVYLPHELVPTSKLASTSVLHMLCGTQNDP